MDSIRKEAEATDCLMGFQMFQSMGGGTGSGLGSLILSECSELYAGYIHTSFPVFPSSKMSDTVVESYNTTLSMLHLIE